LANRATVKGWCDSPFAQVVENDRLAVASRQDVTGDWRALGFPEIKQDFAQLIGHGDKPLALLRLRRPNEVSLLKG